MRIALQPWIELPPKWDWLRRSPMLYDFQRSFGLFHLDRSQEMIDGLTPKKGTYYFSQKS